MPESITITIYDADGRDRTGLGAWRTMFREIREYRELIYRLTARDIVGRFKQSFLGYIWIVLPPIATTVIFTLLREAGVVKVPMEGQTMPYALFVLVGTTIWGTFTQVTMAATGSITSAGALVSKIYFPREVLVLSAVGRSLVNTLIRLGVVILTFVLFLFAPHWEVIFAPLILLPMMAFGIGMGLIFAPINTMMHDMSRMLEFAFQFGMFLAPTVYPTPMLSDVTSQWQMGLYWLHSMNPVTHFIHAVQGLIQYGTFVPDAGFWASTILSFLILAVGWRFFHVCEPLLAERL